MKPFEGLLSVKKPSEQTNVLYIVLVGVAMGHRGLIAQVDPEFGAGLDLAADPYGYLVEAIDEKPGQRSKA